LNRAGTPENFKSFVVAGGIGTGETNYTGSYIAPRLDTCSVLSQRSVVYPITTIKPWRDRIHGATSESVLNENLEIAAIPNPSSSIFNLTINGNNTSPVQVRVTDIFGRIVEQYEKVSANTILKIGQKLNGGSYYVEVVQADQRKFLKIIKVN